MNAMLSKRYSVCLVSRHVRCSVLFNDAFPDDGVFDPEQIIITVDDPS
jgi:hypothetical protein